MNQITVGRPRPDLIDRTLPLSPPFVTTRRRPRKPTLTHAFPGCMPAPGAHDHIPGLANVSVCTQTDMFKLNDGFKSFPSGHSAVVSPPARHEEKNVVADPGSRPPPLALDQARSRLPA